MKIIHHENMVNKPTNQPYPISRPLLIIIVIIFNLVIGGINWFLLYLLINLIYESMDKIINEILTLNVVFHSSIRRQKRF